MQLTPLAVALGVGLALGFAAGYGAYDTRIQDCIERAEQLSDYGPTEARAIRFAECASPRQYDQQFYYRKFKGK